MAGGRKHWIKDAVVAGLERIDIDELLQKTADHVTTKGEWETGVISPSLSSVQCRLQRVKRFIGHGYQPGKTRMAVKQGMPDAISNINFLRGFLMEGVLVACLKDQLGDGVIGTAPGLVFGWTPDEDAAHEILEDNGGMPSPKLRFAGHPDVMVADPGDGRPALIQIKCPSVYKLDRVQRQGDEDALSTYRSQLVTEMYIGRMMGIPIERNYLLLAAWENSAKMTEPRLIVVECEWEEGMETIPELVAYETLWDADRALGAHRWPKALPEHQWDTFPCSYCSYPRLGDFDLVPCDQSEEWEKVRRGEATMREELAEAAARDVPVDEIPPNEKIVPITDLQRRRRPASRRRRRA